MSNLAWTSRKFVPPGPNALCFARSSDTASAGGGGHAGLGTVGAGGAIGAACAGASAASIKAMINAFIDHILNTPNGGRSGIGALRQAAKARPSTSRVWAGSMMPSSHSRAVACHGLPCAS